MILVRRNALYAVIPILALPFIASAADWRPAAGKLMTAWAAKVDPNCPLPEYPRPQMVRKEWTNLNGLWDYAITDAARISPASSMERSSCHSRVESALSGVMKPLTDKQWLWYRRSFNAPETARRQAAAAALRRGGLGGDRLGQWQRIGAHRGGYDPFTLTSPTR